MKNKKLLKEEVKEMLARLDESMNTAGCMFVSFMENADLEDNEQRKTAEIANKMVELIYYRASTFARTLKDNMEIVKELDSSSCLEKCIDELIKDFPLEGK